MTTEQVTLPAGLESIEGIEAVLETLKLCLQSKVPDYVEAISDEWVNIADVPLPVPDDMSYRVVNDENLIPPEVETFPFISLMGASAIPDENVQVSDPNHEYFYHDIVVRVTMKSDIPEDLTRQIFRYTEAIKRTVKFFSRGAYDEEGSQYIIWDISRLMSQYSSLTPSTPYFMAGDVQFRIRVLRIWA